MAPVLVAAALAFPAAAQQAAQPATVDAAAVADVTTITAKVEAIDLATRQITLKGPSGKSVTLTVDEKVKNLPQVKVGDELVFKYVEAVSIQLKKGSAGRSEVVTTQPPVTAPAGAKPGVAAAKTTEIVANVGEVDAKRSMVMLQGPKGRYVEVKVKDPNVMKDVKVGDSVEVRFTEAMVLEVVAPAKK
jgi:hypothetical protein